jgi:hypothetical protein
LPGQPWRGIGEPTKVCAWLLPGSFSRCLAVLRRSGQISSSLGEFCVSKASQPCSQNVSRPARGDRGFRQTPQSGEIGCSRQKLRQSPHSGRISPGPSHWRSPYGSKSDGNSRHTSQRSPSPAILRSIAGLLSRARIPAPIADYPEGDRQGDARAQRLSPINAIYIRELNFPRDSEAGG